MKREPYTGPLPSVGDFRAQGLRSFTVSCDKPGCPHETSVGFNVLDLPDDMVFIDIPRRLRFVCSVCGHCKVRVRPNWTGYRAAGTGWEHREAILAARGESAD